MTSTRNIKSTIVNALEDWIGTLPEYFREEVRESVVVTGGCITSLLREENVNDYDIYFSSNETAAKVLNHYFSRLGSDYNCSARVDFENNLLVDICGKGNKIERSKHKPGAGIISIQKNKRYEGKDGIYVPLYLTDNALTLTNGIQLITRWTGTPDKIHETFDFVHTTNYFTYQEGLVFRPEAMKSLLTNELRYGAFGTGGTQYPVAALFRARKFIERGWKINAGELFKIAFAISKLDLTNAKVLQEQLVGVDLLLFAEFLEKIEAKNIDLSKVDMGYVFNLMEEVFDGTGSVDIKSGVSIDSNNFRVSRVVRRATY
jgi:hypothetical protein